VQDAEQRPVHHSQHNREPDESENKAARRREESMGTRRPIACVPVDDAAGHEQPHDDVGGRRADDDNRTRDRVHERAQVVEHRGKPDDRRSKRRAESGGLVGELLHPFVVHALRR
jgi:hypothetical protein